MMPTTDSIRTILLYALAIIAVVVVVATSVFAISSLATKSYTAQSQLVVTAGLGLDPSGSGDVLTAPRIAQTYGTLARTRPILLEVIKLLDLPYSTEELDAVLRVTTDATAPFITIAATDAEPARAQMTANALADILVREGTIAASTGTPDRAILAIIERATVPNEPSGPRVLFNTLLAAAVTLVLALVAGAVVAYFRDWEPDEPDAGE